MFRGPVRSVVVGVMAASSALVFAACFPSPPAGAAWVSTEAQLRAAFADSGVTVIEVKADIDLVDCTAGAVERNPASEPAPVTINGHRHTVRQTCSDNVFIQNSTDLMTVNDLVITGGHGGNGGGVFAQGALTIVDSMITGNRADGTGGGLASAEGLVTVLRSTVDSNSSSGGGGGIANGPDSPGIVVTDSTVSNNVNGGIGTAVVNDAGAANQDVSVRVVNSTITGNRLGGLGGGIFSAGSLVLVYSTVAGNQANQAFDNIDAVTMESFGSVVAGGPVNCDPGIQTTSHGYNFSDDGTCNFTDATDRQSAGDPLLGSLADNGGPTQTRLPGTGSPLVDAIPVEACRTDGAANVTRDQRGVPRPQGDGCDIGSVEVVVRY